jgi:hypothetical protein
VNLKRKCFKPENGSLKCGHFLSFFVGSKVRMPSCIKKYTHCICRWDLVYDRFKTNNGINIEDHTIAENVNKRVIVIKQVMRKLRQKKYPKYFTFFLDYFNFFVYDSFTLLWRSYDHHGFTS